MSATFKLDPCLFCLRSNVFFNQCSGTQVKCGDCGAGGPVAEGNSYESSVKAAALWNKAFRAVIGSSEQAPEQSAPEQSASPAPEQSASPAPEQSAPEQSASPAPEQSAPEQPPVEASPAPSEGSLAHQDHVLSGGDDSEDPAVHDVVEQPASASGLVDEPGVDEVVTDESVSPAEQPASEQPARQPAPGYVWPVQKGSSEQPQDRSDLDDQGSHAPIG